MTFNNIPNRPALGISALITNSENVSGSGYYSNDGGRPVVCGIDIDWCGAQLPNSSSNAGTETITTTEQLLQLIDEMNQRIYVLTAAVIALSNK